MLSQPKVVLFNATVRLFVDGSSTAVLCICFKDRWLQHSCLVIGTALQQVQLLVWQEFRGVGHTQMHTILHTLKSFRSKHLQTWRLNVYNIAFKVDIAKDLQLCDCHSFIEPGLRWPIQQFCRACSFAPMFWLLVLLPLTGAMCFGKLYRRCKNFDVQSSHASRKL